MGVFELVIMNDELRDMISAGASTDQLRDACRKQGMHTLREAGLRAIFNGILDDRGSGARDDVRKTISPWSVVRGPWSKTEKSVVGGLWSVVKDRPGSCL